MSPTRPPLRRRLPPGPPGLARGSLVAHRTALAAVRRGRRRPRSGPTLKVAILLLSADDRSGVVPAALNVARWLAERHEVEVVSVVGRRPQPFFTLPAGVRRTTLDARRAPATGRGRLARALLRRLPGVLIHPSDRRADAATAWTDLRLVRALRRLDADIVIATRFSLNVVVTRAAPRGAILIGQEHMHLAGKPAERLRAIRDAYPRLDAVAVLTERDRRDYEALLGPHVRVARIPNAVTPLGGPLSPLTSPVILGAGRLAWQKGFPRLIRAFARAAREEPEWRLRICGYGAERRRLRALAADRGVEERVELPGAVKDMAAEMEGAAVFALSSRFEGYPMVLIEAMSKGLPVVAFDVPTGPADIVVDGETGFLIADGDVAAFAAALRELIRDPEKRRRFGAAGAERAQAFTLEQVGPLWDALVHGLRGAGEPGAR